MGEAGYTHSNPPGALRESRDHTSHAYESRKLSVPVNGTAELREAPPHPRPLSYPPQFQQAPYLLLATYCEHVFSSSSSDIAGGSTAQGRRTTAGAVLEGLSGLRVHHDGGGSVAFAARGPHLPFSGMRC